MTSKGIWLAALTLSGCAGPMAAPSVRPGPVEVQILAINDFHGNLERPEAPLRVALSSDQFATMQAGGAAVLASELSKLRTGHPQTITVAAGDLIGASPLTSAYFLDEPTIYAMNLIGLDLASVGNHEFDKGAGELLRMQSGGCARFTTRVPCRLEPFAGARFHYLAANVVRPDGTTLFPSAAIRQFGPVRIGFIGVTLKETAILVAPGGVAGLRFTDEAATANAQVPQLRAAGADTIILLIHQGGRTPETYKLQDCGGLSGDILPILDRLDPTIRTVVSGHTHNAYACEIERGGVKRLLTSAGKYGYLASDIRLTFDPTTHALLTQRGSNVPVIGDGTGDPKVAALVKRYADAAAPAAARVVGRLPGPLPKSETDGESPAADLIADAFFSATKGKDRGNADLAFINASGVRTDLIPRPDGRVTYGQIFALQPFGNNLVVKTVTGTQLKALLEQQFKSEGSQTKVASLLVPSSNFRFSYDLSKPSGSRVTEMLLGSKPVRSDEQYRVATNNFLASGGDGFSVLAQGTDELDAGLDLDALEGWIATNPAVPSPGRTQRLLSD